MFVGPGTLGRQSAARIALSQKLLLVIKGSIMCPLARLLSVEVVGNVNVLNRN